MTSTPTCEFCDEFSGGALNGFRHRYGETQPDRGLLATGLFRVFPSIGQLLEGYLLIVPVVHHTTLGDMPKDLLTPLSDLCERVRTVLSEVYGSCVLFEHGARGPAHGGCGIYHAHLHATPLATAPDPVSTLKGRFPFTELSGLSELRNRSAGLSSYLFLQDSEQRLYLFDTGPLPSQFMRKLLADSLGVQNWDWRAAGREERLLATISQLSGRFETPQDPAPRP